MRVIIIAMLFFISCSSVQVITLQKNEPLPFKESCIRVIKQEPIEGNSAFKRVYYKDKCR